MAKTFDYSNPAFVTIKNILPAEEKVFLDDHIVDGKVDIDAGTLQHAKILKLAEDDPDVSTEHPAGSEYFIEKNTRMVQLYKTNQWVILDGQDQLKMKVEWGEEAAYFDSLAGDTFSVEITAGE